MPLLSKKNKQKRNKKKRNTKKNKKKYKGAGKQNKNINTTVPKFTLDKVLISKYDELLAKGLNEWNKYNISELKKKYPKIDTKTLYNDIEAVISHLPKSTINPYDLYFMNIDELQKKIHKMLEQYFEEEIKMVSKNNVQLGGAMYERIRDRELLKCTNKFIECEEEDKEKCFTFEELKDKEDIKKECKTNNCGPEEPILLQPLNKEDNVWIYKDMEQYFQCYERDTLNQVISTTRKDPNTRRYATDEDLKDIYIKYLEDSGSEEIKQKLKDRLISRFMKIAHYVEQNPFKSAGIAIGSGVAVGIVTDLITHGTLKHVEYANLSNAEFIHYLYTKFSSYTYISIMVSNILNPGWSNPRNFEAPYYDKDGNEIHLEDYIKNDPIPL